MDETCINCKHSMDGPDDRPNYVFCTVTIPANLAAALGFKDQFDIPNASTHAEWYCALFQEGESV